jgi:hypothetical protein
MFRHQGFFTAMGKISYLLIAGVPLAAHTSEASAQVGTTAALSQSHLSADAHWGGGSQRDGNGSNNRISAPFNSPNFNRGFQHSINANSGGTTVNQFNLCKKKIHCKVSQRVFLFDR